MFGLPRKNIAEKKIENISDVTKVTKFYIAQKQWEKASHLLKEAKSLEKQSANNKIEHLDKDLSEGEYNKLKDPILKFLNHNIEIIHSLESLLIKEQSKHKFVPESIKRYEDAVKSIKTLILLREWKQAKSVLREIKEAEKSGVNNLISRLEAEGDTLFSEHEKKKQLKIYNKKEKQLDKLLFKVKEQERKYNNKISKEKFKIRFKKIKSEIELLSKTGKSQQALGLLKSFLEDNKENSQVIRFYNKEKSEILRNIERQQKREEQKIQKNLKLEALKLAGKTVHIDESEDSDNNQTKQKSLVGILKSKANIYKNLKEKIRKKKLVDEVTLLINENENVNKELAEKKLATIHKGLTKEIYTDAMYGYDLYGKILGADKISGDTFGMYNGKKKYNFFLGDATGHGIKAGLIIALMTRLFNKYSVKKNLPDLSLEINNGLKQDLKSRNFITGILFQIDKDDIDRLRYVGFGHEPMFVYKKATKTVEKIVPGGLAAGIRMIKKLEDIKEKELVLEDGDIVLSYSDGVIEAKSPDGEFYGFERLRKNFLVHAQIEKSANAIYEKLIQDLISFRGGSSFTDDTTIILLRRDTSDDVQARDSKYIKGIAQKEELEKKHTARLAGKTKKQIQKELKVIKKEKELNLIVISLKKLYHIGEFLTLKQEAIRYIKAGWVHKDINFYLKKALENETKYKINLKNKKIENKFNILEQLYKKGDFDTVINEVEDIIAKDGDI